MSSPHALVINTIQQLTAGKELKKFPEIKDQLSALSESLKDNKDTGDLNFFDPLENLTKAKNPTVIVQGLDLLSKMITYQYFKPEEFGKIVDIINQTFNGEGTDERVLIQIFKVLQSAVTSGILHEAPLLLVVRTAYNIFLMSKPGSSQSVAQSILSQMILFIFGRIKLPVVVENSSSLGKRESLKQKSSEEVASAIVSELIESAVEKHEGHDLDDDLDIQLRDGYLVFRALCRLSLKPLPDISPSKKDVYILGLRSKILSLELLSVIVREHFTVISSTYPITNQINNEESPNGDDKQNEVDHTEQSVQSSGSTSFVLAVKQYLCASLSRNAVSLVPEVLSRSLEIFARLVYGMRNHLKREIEVFFSDIFLSTLESKSNVSITYHQKLAIIKTVSNIIATPNVLIELYLNFDCDPDAMDNLFERIVTVMSRILATPELKLHQAAPSLPPSENIDVGGFGIAPATSSRSIPISVPKLTRLDSSVSPSSVDVSSTPSNTNTLVSSSLAPSVISLNLGNIAPEKDQSLKWRALECLSTLMQSLVTWEAESSQLVNETPHEDGRKMSLYDERILESAESPDNLSKLENAKGLKTLIKEGVRLFNWKYNKGIQFLVKNGVIENTPSSISKFLLSNPILSKKNIGEYLGEGEPFNISVMHTFVEMIDFEHLDFVAALRFFLQHFRLPGEAQKIDRFMLKFAERFLIQNPDIFANADTGYVLAYSVVMLNTDLYNPQVKKRMTKADFIKNNRGINDGKDLSEVFLGKVYDDIAAAEIKLKEEHELAAVKAALTKDDGYQNMSDKQKKQALFQVSEEIAKKSEAAFKSIARNGLKKQGVAEYPFFHAKRGFRVKSMFDYSWMPVLAGVSTSLSEVALDDDQTCKLITYIFRASVHLGAIFDMETARNAFITTLTKNTGMTSVNDLVFKVKNVECMKGLLEILYLDGNYLGTSWTSTFRSISNLERLLSLTKEMNGNVELGGFLPGVTSGLHAKEQSESRFFKNPLKSPINVPEKEMTLYQESMLQGIAQSLLVGIDHVFSSSIKLDGTAIVQFVKSLCDVSIEEIQHSLSSSPLTAMPRMFCLTKLVEISYYNMNRIRLEWLNIWAHLGEHFNKVGCHGNQHVALFCVDSLRQLSMKFLEKQELANFKFQKDFLKPFEHILQNHNNPVIKDMAIRCLHQIVLAKSSNIRSGWKTVFSILVKAAKEENENVFTMAFNIIKHVNERCVDEALIRQNYLSEFSSCLVEFSRNLKFPKINLQSVDMMRSIIVHISGYAGRKDEIKNEALGSSENITEGTDVLDQVASKDDPILRLWFPVLFGLYEMVMSCELEARTRAVNLLFEVLKKNGSKFPTEFWDLLARGVIFPIFDDLRLTKSEKRQAQNKEEMAIWINTTLIQALRQLIELFSYSFASLESALFEGVLELIMVCFSAKQDNETLAKIGASCLEQLIVNNCAKMQDSHWEKLIATCETLFSNSRADLLVDHEFIKSVMSEADQKSNGKTVVSDTSSVVTNSEIQSQSDSVDTSQFNGFSRLDDEANPNDDANRSNTSLNRKKNHQQLKRDFQLIIVNCVLQLIVIQMVTDIMASESPSIFPHIPTKYLIRILKCCDKSFKLAREFNSNIQFRVALYNNGFMNQLPNLLKQETMSVNCLVTNLLKLYDYALGIGGGSVSLSFSGDQDEFVSEVRTWLFETVQLVLSHYSLLDPDSKKRNIQTWTPVISGILKALLDLSDDHFRIFNQKLYPDLVKLVLKPDMSKESRAQLCQILERVGRMWNIAETST